MPKRLSKFELTKTSLLLRRKQIYPPAGGYIIFPTISYGFPLAILIGICQYIDMFCINCFHPTTNVTNSRGKKKHALVWRRRHCPNCGHTFTTHEKPSLEDNQKVHLPSGKVASFNIGHLILSIAKAFTHSEKMAKNHSLALAETVEEKLSTQKQIITPEEIAAVTHAVLRQFDELAALQYAAQHDLITSIRKRGRPSTSWRGPQTDESPSR